MAISQKLQEKLQVYEQAYFGLDLPVPFKKDLFIYPVTVKDYYKFYSNLSCLTMDKNVVKKKQLNDKGFEEIIEVSNPKGISQSYMAYLIEQMENDEYGSILTAQVIALLELVMHIKNGFYCPNCHEGELKYSDMLIDIKKIENDSTLSDDEKLKKKREYFLLNSVCPHCGQPRRDIFCIKDTGTIKKICIYDNELSPQDFDELIAIILHYNILDYDGDRYIDPLLKKDLEAKAQLQNKNYNSPSLEKQLVCISISSPYKIEELKDISLRKLTMMLKTIDAKNVYYTQLSGMYSGMVKFKSEPKHWIFSDNKKDMSKEVMSMGDVKEKFKHVT